MSSDASPTRTVAIAGRPNVGKSAIFNRLLRRRLAIVHDEPGVTRDRIAGEAEWNGERFTLIDTGGIALMDRARAGDEIAAAVRAQVEAALDDAAAVIFVADIQSGVAPLDEEVAGLLRGRSAHVLLAANKADDPRHDPDAADFARFGFPVFPVSALHGRGFDDLMDAVLPHLPPAGETGAASAPLVVTIAGRPNAGKSSFVNRLLRRDRVVVSSAPGTTRDSIEIPFSIGEGPRARQYVLIDTAGMRPPRRVDTAVEKFSLIRVKEAIGRSDLVALMMDAEEGPSRQDKRIADMILSGHKGCLLIANKWDLMEARRPKGLPPVRQKNEYLEAVRREVPFLDFAPMCFISAKTGQGVARTVETFDRVAARISTSFATGVLNRALQDALARQAPPALRGRRLKLYYAAQTGVRPIRLKLFVNSPDLVAPAYRRYLDRRLRAQFGLDGAPVVFHFVPRRREA